MNTLTLASMNENEAVLFAILGTVGIITVALAANAVWRAVMPPPGLPRGAACGSCGYELTTVEGGRCSECGADLLKAGVTTRRNVVRTAGSLPAALLGWTVIAATLAGVGLYVVSWYSITTSTAAMVRGRAAPPTGSPRPLLASL